jgi:hypothetical protein
MFAWKTDPLYRLMFREVESLWRRLQQEGSSQGTGCPEGFRIEEHSSVSWEKSPGSTTLKDVWIFDDSGPRLFPGLRRVPHDYGEKRGNSWQFGLIRFHIAGDGSRLDLSADVSPGRALDSRYRVQTPGEPTELVPEHQR